MTEHCGFGFISVILDECWCWTVEKASLRDTYRLPRVSHWGIGGGCEGLSTKRRRNNETRSCSASLPTLLFSRSLSLKWIILVMLVTGCGLDFDLCSSKAKIKESIYCYFMAVGMMNGLVSGPKQAAVSLPWILIAKVASNCSGFKAQWEGEGTYTALRLSPLPVVSLFLWFYKSVSHLNPPPPSLSKTVRR